MLTASLSSTEEIHQNPDEALERAMLLLLNAHWHVLQARWMSFEEIIGKYTRQQSLLWATRIEELHEKDSSRKLELGSVASDPVRDYLRQNQVNLKKAKSVLNGISEFILTEMKVDITGVESFLQAYWDTEEEKPGYKFPRWFLDWFIKWKKERNTLRVQRSHRTRRLAKKRSRQKK